MSDLVLNPIECDKILICILLFSIHCFVSLSSYYKEEDCSCFALGKTRLIIVDKEEKENVSEMFSHSTVVPYSTKHFCLPVFTSCHCFHFHISFSASTHYALIQFSYTKSFSCSIRPFLDETSSFKIQF